VAFGAKRVIALPVILFAAGHVKVELPHELDRAKGRHPGVEFVYGRHIGLHPLILEIVEERMAEAEARWPGRPEETAILVVGRGSSDPDANSDLYKAARLLWEGWGAGGGVGDGAWGARGRAGDGTGAVDKGKRYPWVEVCFIGITTPSLPEGLARCVALGAKRILALPYFLFTGVLIPRIHRLAREFAAANPGIEVRVAEYFNGHPNLFKILSERKAEALNGEARMNCALCKYRIRLPGHDASLHAV
jgi:sirohydrochlorin cobaltochelatase